MFTQATVVDALGRSVSVPSHAARIISLVPSETESVATLAGPSRLVGRTRYCEEPQGHIECVPIVGGTKDVDIDAVRKLLPDLVLANQEENSRPAVQALMDAGLLVHVSFPRTVHEGLEWVERAATLLGVEDTHPRVRETHAFRDALLQPPRPCTRAFVPIWRDPWMTFNGDTFASDLLAWCGVENIFHGRERRLPLAADLGLREERIADRDASYDRRYPRLALDEAVRARPDLVLVPDEPYPFTRAHVEELCRAFPAAEVVTCSGKDLFWYGVRIPGALTRLRALIETV